MFAHADKNSALGCHRWILKIVAERAAARAAHGYKLSIAVGQRQIEAREQRRRGREEVGERSEAPRRHRATDKVYFELR